MNLFKTDYFCEEVKKDKDFSFPVSDFIEQETDRLYFVQEEYLFHDAKIEFILK